MKIGCRKGDGRKCITSAGLYGYADILTELIMYRRYLCLGCSDGHDRILINAFYLSVNALHHGFIGAVLRLKYVDELL